jgi:hypothetical protein
MDIPVGAQDKRKTPPFFMTGSINILKGSYFAGGVDCG